MQGQYCYIQNQKQNNKHVFSKKVFFFLARDSLKQDTKGVGKFMCLLLFIFLILLGKKGINSSLEEGIARPLTRNTKFRGRYLSRPSKGHQVCFSKDHRQQCSSLRQKTAQVPWALQLGAVICLCPPSSPGSWLICRGNLPHSFRIRSQTETCQWLSMFDGAWIQLHVF